jgi:defect-in-organelle-trafficking protein DotB
MRDKMLNHKNRKILTIEAPIEFDLQPLQSDSNLVVQHEVGADLENFYRGIVNAMRQAPTDILVGEARDHESINAVIEAVETGHATYATVHAASVVGTFRRMANEFDVSAQSQIIFKILSLSKLIVVQRLVISKCGSKRVPIREWFVFDDPVKEFLMRLTASDALNFIEDAIKSLGQSMRQQAIKSYMNYEMGYEALKAVIGNHTHQEVPLCHIDEKPKDWTSGMGVDMQEKADDGSASEIAELLVEYAKKL